MWGFLGIYNGVECAAERAQFEVAVGFIAVKRVMLDLREWGQLWSVIVGKGLNEIKESSFPETWLNSCQKSQFFKLLPFPLKIQKEHLLTPRECQMSRKGRISSKAIFRASCCTAWCPTMSLFRWIEHKRIILSSSPGQKQLLADWWLDRGIDCWYTRTVFSTFFLATTSSLEHLTLGWE